MRFNEIINEIKMNPTSLMNVAKNLNAKIGIEYEFIFQFSDIGDPEVEDINDSIVYSIDRLITFFQSGDIEQNNLSIYDEVEEYLRNEHEKWLEEKSEKGELINADYITKERMFLKEKYGNYISNVYEKIKDKFDGLYWPQIYIQDNSPSVEKAREHFDENYHLFVGDYEVDSDGSIKVDDEFTEVGVEIKNKVPLSLEDTVYDLEAMRKYISQNGYTNDSTGLHINVSLPNFSLDKLDYVKLALLLGDKYILKMFNRMGNIYTISALERLSYRKGDPATILDKLQENLNQLAGKVFFDSYVDKYTSINIRENRIEFRSPGGDWVSDQNLDFMKQTILRFIIVLDAALDTTKYQREYAKKLYKWIEPDKDYLKDITKAFAMYSVGKLNREQLKVVVDEIRESRPKREPEYEVKGNYYAFGNLSYIWGSGITKKEALENSYKAVIDYNNENPDDLASWAAERRNSIFLPIDKTTHDNIQKGLVSQLKFDSDKKLYIDRNTAK